MLSRFCSLAAVVILVGVLVLRTVLAVILIGILAAVLGVVLVLVGILIVVLGTVLVVVMILVIHDISSVKSFFCGKAAIVGCPGF